jgi:hypothetical protein
VYDLLSGLFVQNITCKIIVKQSYFTFPLCEIMVLMIYENPTDTITDIVGSVIFKGICKKVENVYDSTIGPCLILPDITAFHYYMITRDFEYIGVHKEN